MTRYILYSLTHVRMHVSLRSEALIRSQRGYISPEQLSERHPSTELLFVFQDVILRRVQNDMNALDIATPQKVHYISHACLSNDL